MTTIAVRPALASDAESAVAVLRASITELCVEDHQGDAATLERWLRNKTVDCFRGWLEDADNCLLVAEADGVLAGAGLLRQDGLLGMLYVAPGYQGLGIGGALLTRLEEQAERWAVSEIKFTSTSDARTFYERRGYLSTGEPASTVGVRRDYPYLKVLRAP